MNTQLEQQRIHDRRGDKYRALPVLSAEEAAARARDLAPVLRARAAQAEELRCIPDSSIGDLLDSGLFGLATPRHFGGSELGFAAWLDAMVEIGAACGSTGWVFSVLLGHMHLVSCLPPQAQKEVFANPRTLVASLLRMGGAPLERVEGGYSWQGGVGHFCSGIDHAEWVLLGGSLSEPDGTRDQRFFLIPRSEILVEDDWRTMGLQGTGSKTIRVVDSFVPEHRVMRMADLLQGTTPGAAFHSSVHYRLPHAVVLPMTLCAALLGIARGACQEFEKTLRAKLCKLDSEGIADQTPLLIRLAESEAATDAAIAIVRAEAARLDGCAEPVFTRLDRARYRRNISYAVQLCRDAIDGIFHFAGGASIYADVALQRMWRDLNAGAQHFGLSWEAAAGAYTRAKLDLPPSKSDGAGR